MIIAYDKDKYTNHFLFTMKKLITITIIFHILYQCAIMSEITLNITLHNRITVIEY